MNILNNNIKHAVLGSVVLTFAFAFSASSKEPITSVEVPKWNTNIEPIRCAEKEPVTPPEVLQALTQTLNSIEDLQSAQKATPKIALLFAKILNFSETDTETKEYEIASLELIAVLLTKRATLERLAKQDAAFGCIVRGMYQGFDKAWSEFGL